MYATKNHSFFLASFQRKNRKIAEITIKNAIVTKIVNWNINYVVVHGCYCDILFLNRFKNMFSKCWAKIARIHAQKEFHSGHFVIQILEKIRSQQNSSALLVRIPVRILKKNSKCFVIFHSKPSVIHTRIFVVITSRTPLLLHIELTVRLFALLKHAFFGCAFSFVLVSFLHVDCRLRNFSKQ